jgi:hypothetical protein
MIKKQQKWIALLVTLTFVWLLQVSTMPVAAASRTEQVSSANAEQAPGFIEQEGDSGYAAKKKSILPIVLIGVGVVAVAAVLFLVVLKTKYDITGDWDYKWRNSGDTNWTTHELIFAGSKSSGTVTYFWGTNNVSGTYTVNGKKLAYSWTYTTGGTVSASGDFQTKDKVTGTWTATGTSLHGDFELTRKAGATARLKAPGMPVGTDR